MWPVKLLVRLRWKNRKSHLKVDRNMPTIAEIYQLAEQHRQQGNLREADQHYRAVVQASPQHAEALAGLGLIAQQQGRQSEAAEWLQRSIAANPRRAETHAQLGRVWQQLGQSRPALLSVLRALHLQPDLWLAYETLAVLLGNDLVRALESYRAEPQLFEFLHDMVNNLGNYWATQQQHEKAKACYLALIQVVPNFPDPHHNLGSCLRREGRIDEALASFREALQLKPDYDQALDNFTDTCYDYGRLQEAFDLCCHILKQNPNAWLAHHEQGIVYFKQGRFHEAQMAVQKCLQLNPQYADAHNLLASTYINLDNAAAAIPAYLQALQLQPHFPIAWYNLAAAFLTEKKTEKAILALMEAIKHKPNYGVALSQVVHLLRKVCDWERLGPLVDRFRNIVNHIPTEQVTPFSVIALYPASTAEEQLKAAQSFCRHLNQPVDSNGEIFRQTPRSAAQRKIKVGYVSADFRYHATSFLIAELFEKHDRDRFEIYAYAFDTDDGSEVRRRIQKSVHQFVDIRSLSTLAAAQRISADQVDILIDLKGYTQHSRAQIFAHRPAPIQVNYLGYPGTMGAPFIDYILVDDFVVPPDQAPFYTEKLVYLPGCYQVNDSQRVIDASPITRQSMGLPTEGFLFCSFNDTYKITPDVFATWMRILHAVPGSVLWLMESNNLAPAALVRAAEKQGISRERLFFAPKWPVEKHLSRYTLADLFLDTFPVNAHTTASDALWTGLPVLTLCGNTFVSRVAGSLLKALDLSELITTNLADYESLAIQLAQHPKQLADLRARLVAQRSTSDLFNAEHFARKIEAAFTQMWEIHCAGESPRSFRVTEEMLLRCR
jgi:protein O-GlcNAc transferase